MEMLFEPLRYFLWKLCLRFAPSWMIWAGSSLLIPFCTPVKSAKRESLSKQNELIHRKAESCLRKWAEFISFQLGFSRGVRLQRNSGVPDWITNFLRKKFALPSSSVPIGVRNKLSLFALP